MGFPGVLIVLGPQESFGAETRGSGPPLGDVERYPSVSTQYMEFGVLGNKNPLFEPIGHVFVRVGGCRGGVGLRSEYVWEMCTR